MIKKWDVIERKMYNHSPYRSIEDVTFKLPSGDEKIFSLKKEGVVVAILAIDEDENVILAKQYRPGPDRILDEIPGGAVDEGESPLDAAKRELREETGYESNHWVKLGVPLDCAYSTIERHAYLATRCKKTSELDLDETEFIEVDLKSLDDFLDQLTCGDCTDPEVGWMGLWEMGYLKKK